MPTRTTDFPTALKATLHDVFEATWKDNLGQYKKVFDVETSFDNYEDERQIQGPDSIPESTEGGVFERVEIENVRSKRFTHAVYKGEVKITREALDDIKYPKIVDAVKKLSVATTRTIERIAAAVYYNGLSGAETTPDGVALFHDSHPLANPLAGNPTLCSNLGTETLSNSNIRDMRILGRRMRDEHGALAPCNLTQLIVTPDLENEALMQRGSSLNPDNAENGKNVAGGAIKDVVVLDFLAEAPANSQTMWFMRDPSMSRMKFFWRVKPERSIVRDKATNDYLYRVYFRCSAGASHWAGVAGSAGTGTASALGATVR